MRGKRFCNLLRVEMSQVQIDERILGSADFHLMQDGAGHKIPRRQFSHGMILSHELVHLEVSQVCTFGAQRFRQQESRHLLHVQGRRMELNELQIAEFRTGPEGHRCAVCRSRTGIGRVAIKLAHSPGREQHGGAGNFLGNSLLVEKTRLR